MVHIGTRDGTVTQLDCYTMGHTMGLERSRTQNGTGTPLNWCTINGVVVSTTIRWPPLPQSDIALYHNSMALSATIQWLFLPQLDGGLYHNSRVAAASNCRCTCESQVCSCKCALCSDESSLPQQPPVRYINISRPYLRDKSWGRFSRGVSSGFDLVCFARRARCLCFTTNWFAYLGRDFI